jgi:DNA helicase HerA-like ATPase
MNKSKGSIKVKPKVVKPTTKIDLSKNYYKIIGDGFATPQIHYSNEKLLNIQVPFNMCIIGATGSCKTNFLMNLIEYINCFTKIKLYVKVPDEPLYKYLVDSIRKVEKKLDCSIIEVHSNIDELPDVDSIKEDYDNGEVTLIIFDDLINEKSKKLDKVGAYFTHGRKYNICNVFISQSYFKIPMIIRQNSQYLVFQKIKNKRDLVRILADNTFDIEPDQLVEMYKKAQKLGKAFLIDSKTTDDKLRYRLNEKSIYDF